MFRYYIDPTQRTEEDETRFIEEYWTNKWATEGEDYLNSDLERTELWSIFSRHLKPGARILEGGSGSGMWVRFLTDRGYDVHGIDISKQTIDVISKRFPDLNLSVQDARALEFEDGHFDAYISIGVIEHFEDGPEALLEEVKRVLNPDGLFFVSVPFYNVFYRWQYKDDGDNRRVFGSGVEPTFYQYVMRKPELTGLLGRVGFEIVELMPYEKNRGLQDLQAISKVRSSVRSSGGNSSGGLLKPVVKAARTAAINVLPGWWIAHMMMAVCRKA